MEFEVQLEVKVYKTHFFEENRSFLQSICLLQVFYLCHFGAV